MKKEPPEESTAAILKRPGLPARYLAAERERMKESHQRYLERRQKYGGRKKAAAAILKRPVSARDVAAERERMKESHQRYLERRQKAAELAERRGLKKAPAREAGSVETGERGGRFYRTATGRKIYLHD